jgi:hypothetical protein
MADEKSKELWRKAVELQQSAIGADRDLEDEMRQLTPAPGYSMSAGPSSIGQAIFGQTSGAESAEREAAGKRAEAEAIEYDEQVRRQRGVQTAQEQERTALLGGTPNSTEPLSSAPTGLQPTKRTVEGMEYPPDVLARRAELADKRIAIENEIAGRRGQMAANAINMAKQVSQRRHAAEALAKGGEKYAQEYMRRLSAAYDEAEINIASLRVDPQRWEEDTPALAQVLMALASSAFSFFSGGQGPNPVVALIDRAIERDVQAQMANAEMQMKAAGMQIDRERTLGELGTAMHSAMYERTLNTVEAILQEGGLEAQGEEQYIMAQQLMDKAIQARMAAYDATARTYTETSESPAGQTKPMNITYDNANDYGKKVATVKKGLDLMQRVRAAGNIDMLDATRLISFLKNDDRAAADLKADLLSFIREISRGTVEVGNFSQSDAKVIENTIMSAKWDQSERWFQKLLDATRLSVEQLESQYDASGRPAALTPHYNDLRSSVVAAFAPKKSQPRSANSGRAK